MAVGQVIITKSVPWQGRQEQFSNVYDLDDIANTAEAGEAAADSIVALERAVHFSTVTFEEVRVYTIQGLAGYEGIYRESLTGNGLATAQSQIYRECAVLIKFELPRSGIAGFGRFRQLMKWLHTGGLPGGATSQATGGTALDVTHKGLYLDSYATPLMNQSHGGGRLSNADGVRPIGVKVHDFLEHRQFHQGRKES